MIRLATAKDWDSISDISRRSGYVDYINRIGPAFLDRGETLVFEDSKIEGFTKIYYLEDKAAWLSAMRVDPDYWRGGIGTKLTLASMDRARERGYGVSRVLIYNDNFRSLKLYEKLGGKVTATYDFFQGLPDLSGFERSVTRISGYVNTSWEFTYFQKDEPLNAETFTGDGWKIIRPDENTAQIMKRGKGKLELMGKDGFTCAENTGTTVNLFSEDTEISTGMLLEIALK